MLLQDLQQAIQIASNIIAKIDHMLQLNSQMQKQLNKTNYDLNLIEEYNSLVKKLTDAKNQIDEYIKSGKNINFTDIINVSNSLFDKGIGSETLDSSVRNILSSMLQFYEKLKDANIKLNEEIKNEREFKIHPNRKFKYLRFA